MSEQSRSTTKWPHTRTTQRHTHHASIVYKGRFGSNFPGVTRDISPLGVYIVTTNAVAVGTELVLYLPIEVRPGKTQMCILSGKIVRLGGKTEETGFAVLFDSSVSNDTKAKLSNLINRIMSDT